MFTAYGRDGQQIWAVKRDELHRLLVDRAQATSGVRLLFGARVLDVDVDEPALLVEGTEGALRMRYEHVIGCDGVHSRVRAALTRRGFDSQVHRLPWGYMDLDLRPQQAGARWATDAFHYWPRGGALFGAFPTRDGGFTGSLFLPLRGAEFCWDAPRDRLPALFARAFPDLAACDDGLAAQLLTRPINPVHTVHSDRWTWQGTAALVGDACHAMAPFMGQGMNCAFEDARVLDQCLGSGLEWPDALAAYERRRRKDVDAIVAISHEHYLTLTRPPEQAEPAPAQALRQRLTDLFPERFVPLYERCAFTHQGYAEAQRHEQALHELTARLLTEHGPALPGADDDRLRRVTVDSLAERNTPPTP